MKKQIITFSLGLLTLGTFAQKKELKTIRKAIESKNFADAMLKSKALEETIKNADDKYKSWFYFLKGKALVGQKKYADAAKSLNKLIAFEKQVGKKRYTAKAEPILAEVVQNVSKRAVDAYNVKKDYKSAAKDFYLIYQLRPQDTTFVYNAAVSATQAKEYGEALKYYRELQALGYTGIETQYLATNKKGEEVNLGSKSNRDFMVKSGQYKNPKTKVSESKKGTIAKSIALILKEQGKTDEAIQAIKDARKTNPKDDSLIFAAAEIYYKLKKMDEYGKLMEEAATLRPNDPVLFYNLGVVNANQGNIEGAIKNYKKSIELKPDYYEANLNMAAVILSKDKAVVEEINNNLDNEKKYNELMEKQKNIYREALPYLEKADQLKRDIDTVKTLKNIYEVLEMEAKAKEFVALYKSMR